MSGMEAIEAARSHGYDLIFMDHKMPGMDGIEATLRIRELGDGSKRVPIIALTANAVSGVREMFLQNDFDGFLAKPIGTSELKSILRKWIPKEKQTEYAEEREEKKSHDNQALRIEGLDIQKGISRSGGTNELFLETLAIFYDEWNERITAIKDSLETGNLSLYTTHVHGLKSAVALIGGDKLSVVALALEMAGKRNDAEYIEEHTKLLFQELDSLLKNIHEVIGSEARTSSPADMEALKPMFAVLKSALETLDAGVMHKTVKSLQELAQANGSSEVIKKISNHILSGEYDEAAALVSAVLRGDE
jgi:CheY-like chemotaxis protein/HPt (histidine-containing phosphotransfer) domain-containing protein